jgi:hypothetical protein
MWGSWHGAEISQRGDAEAQKNTIANNDGGPERPPFFDSNFMD